MVKIDKSRILLNFALGSIRLLYTRKPLALRGWLLLGEVSANALLYKVKTKQRLKDEIHKKYSKQPRNWL